MGTVRNITFHGLGTPTRDLGEEAGVWLPVAKFEAILELVAGRPDIRITFDDGNISDFEIGFPRLLEKKLTAEVFVVAGRIGTKGYLGRSQIEEMDRAGMRVGCHGMAHRPWRGLPSQDLHAEIVDAREILEDILGRRVRHVACPMGEYDRRVLRKLRASGYNRVYTSDGGSARPDSWLQARTTIRRRISMDETAEVLMDRSSLPASALRALRRFVKRMR